MKPLIGTQKRQTELAVRASMIYCKVWLNSLEFVCQRPASNPSSLSSCKRDSRIFSFFIYVAGITSCFFFFILMPSSCCKTGNSGTLHIYHPCSKRSFVARFNSTCILLFHFILGTNSANDFAIRRNLTSTVYILFSVNSLVTE